MTFRTKRTGALALWVGILAWVYVFAGVASVASAASKKASCRVHAVLASKDGDGQLPSSLSFLKETLAEDQFAAYKSFHLVDQKTLALQEGTVVEQGFRSGHKLSLSLLSDDGQRLRLRLSLTGRDGVEKLVGTDYSLESGGLFMIQAGKFTQAEVAGKLFFAIQCIRRS